MKKLDKILFHSNLKMGFVLSAVVIVSLSIFEAYLLCGC